MANLHPVDHQTRNQFIQLSGAVAIDRSAYAGYRALEQTSRDARYNCIRVITATQMEDKLKSALCRADSVLNWLDLQLDGGISNGLGTVEPVNGVLQMAGHRYELITFI